MTTIYISLGSNIDPEANLRAAVKSLGQCFGNLLVSPMYRSPAVGMVADDFLNAAVRATTSVPAMQAVQLLHQIEDECLRDRSQPKFSSRTLDLDLLLYDDLVISSAALTLPRPDITAHAFVLQPLADIAADVIHPQTGMTLAAMLDEFRLRQPQQFDHMQQVDDGFLHSK